MKINDQKIIKFGWAVGKKKKFSFYFKGKLLKFLLKNFNILLFVNFFFLKIGKKKI